MMEPLKLTFDTSTIGVDGGVGIGAIVVDAFVVDAVVIVAGSVVVDVGAVGVE